MPVVDPTDFSAWIEVFIGGKWHSIDPLNNVPKIGRIVVAFGRDAADVRLINSSGAHELKSFRLWTYEVDESSVEMPPALGALVGLSLFSETRHG